MDDIWGMGHSTNGLDEMMTMGSLYDLGFLVYIVQNCRSLSMNHNCLKADDRDIYISSHISTKVNDEMSSSV